MVFYSEELMNPSDLIEKELAKKNFFPSGTFAYSQAIPVTIKFPRPVQLSYIYLKKHRAADFYVTKSIIIFKIFDFL